MWGPPVISWFINPMNPILLSMINHSYWSYVHQISDESLTGAPPTVYKSQMISAIQAALGTNALRIL
jgi:hypothetical protein